MNSRRDRKFLTTEALNASIRKLREADEVGSSLHEGGDSLDNQVDQYLSGFESEAKTTKVEALDLRSLQRKLILEEDIADEKLTLDTIDVESFCNSVKRLIDNYDSLLEVRSTLVRRSERFLKNDYSQEVVDAFVRIMREEHDIEAGKTADEVNNDEFSAPAADRAGPEPAGTT